MADTRLHNLYTASAYEIECEALRKHAERLEDRITKAKRHLKAVQGALTDSEGNLKATLRYHDAALALTAADKAGKALEGEEG